MTDYCSFYFTTETIGNLRGWVQSPDWTSYWTTALDYWTPPNCEIHLVQCRTEAMYLFTQLLLILLPTASFLEFLEVKVTCIFNKLHLCRDAKVGKHR